jgi:hypothetical protein
MLSHAQSHYRKENILYAFNLCLTFYGIYLICLLKKVYVLPVQNNWYTNCLSMRHFCQVLYLVPLCAYVKFAADTVEEARTLRSFHCLTSVVKEISHLITHIRSLIHPLIPSFVIF